MHLIVKARLKFLRLIREQEIGREDFEEAKKSILTQGNFFDFLKIFDPLFNRQEAEVIFEDLQRLGNELVTTTFERFQELETV